jgi:heme exporter protein C
MCAMLRYANPTNFLRLAGRLIPWTAGLTVVLIAVGLYLTFFVAPADYQQGETVRIMYLHVPAAWLAMFAYMVMTSAALGTLVWRHPLADAAQKAAAPLGAAFTFICLVTGSLWGKPMWGAWWVWDARLTSMLVLFLIYLGLVALWQTIEDPGRARAPPRFSPSSASSTFRSSNSRSTGGTRCISPPRSSRPAARRSIPPCSGRC